MPSGFEVVLDEFRESAFVLVHLLHEEYEEYGHKDHPDGGLGFVEDLECQFVGKLRLMVEDELFFLIRRCMCS
jgi:hypothetical protein